jgi:hypothetical protein
VRHQGLIQMHDMLWLSKDNRVSIAICQPSPIISFFELKFSNYQSMNAPIVFPWMVHTDFRLLKVGLINSTDDLCQAQT